MGAAEHFHQRAFAGAVFADQRQHFAGAGFQLHAAQGLRGPEALADVFHFENVEPMTFDSLTLSPLLIIEPRRRRDAENTRRI